MTPGKAPSLRRALLLNLLIPTSMLAAALGLAGLLLIHKTIETAYDRVLDGSVKAIAERIAVEDGEISVDLPQVALGMLETRANDSVYYNVSYDQTLVTGYQDLPLADAAAIPVGTIKHLNSLYRGTEVRVAAMTQAAYGKSLPVLIEVAETTNGRATARRELLLALVALEIGIIATAAVLVWFAVRRGLSPLVDLGREIDARQFGTGANLQRLDLENIPLEAHPPVRAMNELFARLDAAIQVIRDFIADASHQMKTPLASLRVHLALLQRDSGHLPGNVENIAEIERSTKHLDRLVAQLIAMARAEQAAVAEPRIDAAFSDLVTNTSEAVGTMAPFAAAKNVELAFEPEVDRAPVNAEPSMLHDILTNLIDNAIRYNHDGGSVVVGVFAGNGRYGVKIADDGPGIAPEHRERVFDRFYRIPAANRPAGSGLGLSIVRTLLRQDAGTIELTEGIGGRGLTVTVSFAATNLHLQARQRM
ncbi:sensor histidine kinase [Bradyrhizobium arachidis]|uniref:sensor histidine kinase n=1 Tax=Bradyrhizobium arachidis TaxID=858423 RepID=UPI00216301AA|nr:sensor histidine kinase [Bradyrhizobium arachidis]UVO31427.1 sensor histidine kinase [Bradyrhizobium arachidis]